MNIRIYILSLLFAVTCSLNAQVVMKVKFKNGEVKKYDVTEETRVDIGNKFNPELGYFDDRLEYDYDSHQSIYYMNTFRSWMVSHLQGIDRINDIDTITWETPLISEPGKAPVFKIDPENLEVRTSAYKVKFDPTVIDEPVELKVTQAKGLSAPIEGVNRSVIYDFNLGDKHQLTGTVEIRIPISLGLDCVAGAAYYNESTHEWEPVCHWYDKSENEVVILSSHLSKFGVFSIDKEHTRAARLVNYYEPTNGMEIDKLMQITQGMVSAPKPFHYLLENFGSGTYADFSMWGFDVIGNAIFASDVENKLGKYCFSDLAMAVSNLGLIFTAYSTAMANYQGKDEVVAQKTMQMLVNTIKDGVSDNLGLSKLALDGAYRVSMIGVALIDLAINKLGEAAIENRKDIYQKSYDLYYSKSGKHYAYSGKGYRTCEDWFNIFYPIFKRNDLTRDQLLTLINNNVQDYVNEFWNLPGDKQAEICNDATSLKWTYDAGQTSTIRREITNDHLYKLYNGYLISVFTAIQRRIKVEVYEQYLKTQDELVKKLNSIVKMSFKDSSHRGDDEPSQYAGFKVKFAELPPTITDPEKWECTINSKGEGIIQYRLLAYLNENIGNKLILLSPEGDEMKYYDFKIDEVNHNLLVDIDLETGGTIADLPEDEWEFEIECDKISEDGTRFWKYDDIDYESYMLIPTNANDDIINAFETNRSLGINTNGDFEFDKSGVTMKGHIDPETKSGEGTFNISTQKSFVSQYDLETRCKMWEEYMKEYIDEHRYEGNLNWGMPPFYRDIVYNANEYFLEYTHTHQVAGKFTIEYNARFKKYIVTLEGTGTYSADLLQQSNLDWESDLEWKDGWEYTYLNMVRESQRIKKENKRFTFSANLLFDE